MMKIEIGKTYEIISPWDINDKIDVIPIASYLQIYNFDKSVKNYEIEPIDSTENVAVLIPLLKIRDQFYSNQVFSWITGVSFDKIICDNDIRGKKIIISNSNKISYFFGSIITDFLIQLQKSIEKI